jgi:xanthine dehydrogenase accessory factor
MKEIKDIVIAYESFRHLGKKAALATVVKVDGSSYRRPGARMLVTEDGELTGAISGGCLEGDALRKAQNVIFQQKAMLVTYDTTDEDDQKFGVGLGCNGIIHVLIEPIDASNDLNPIDLLKKSLVSRQVSIIGTVFSLNNPRQAQIGTVAIFKEGEKSINHSFAGSSLMSDLEEGKAYAEDNKHSVIMSYPHHQADVFFEYLKPPIKILLFGAGNDTIPLVNMADLLGMDVCLIDGRKNYATPERFPKAKSILVGKADTVTDSLEIDRHTVALLMTHNFEYEAVVLKHLLPKELPYIGILGPKKKTVKLMERLSEEGIDVDKWSTNIYAPIGLDLGAETPEEIALAVLAEIQAVIKMKTPSFLKDKEGPIHKDEQTVNLIKDVS